MGGDPLVNVQGHRIHLKALLLSLPGPFQPGLLMAEGHLESFYFVTVQCSFLCLSQ